MYDTDEKILRAEQKKLGRIDRLVPGDLTYLIGKEIYLWYFDVDGTQQDLYPVSLHGDLDDYLLLRKDMMDRFPIRLPHRRVAKVVCESEKIVINIDDPDMGPVDDHPFPKYNLNDITVNVTPRKWI